MNSIAFLMSQNILYTKIALFQRQKNGTGALVTKLLKNVAKNGKMSRLSFWCWTRTTAGWHLLSRKINKNRYICLITAKPYFLYDKRAGAAGIAPGNLGHCQRTTRKRGRMGFQELCAWIPILSLYLGRFDKLYQQRRMGIRQQRLRLCCRVRRRCLRRKR